MTNLKKVKGLLSNWIASESAVRVHFWKLDTYGDFFTGNAHQTGTIDVQKQDFPLSSLLHLSNDAAEKQICSVIEDYSRRNFWERLKWRFLENWNESIDDYQRFYTLIRLRQIQSMYNYIHTPLNLDRISNQPPVYPLFLSFFDTIFTFFTSCFPKYGFFDQFFQENRMFSNFHSEIKTEMKNEFQDLLDSMDQKLAYCSFEFLQVLENTDNIKRDSKDLIQDTAQWLNDIHARLKNIPEDVEDYTKILEKFNGIQIVLTDLIHRLNLQNACNPGKEYDSADKDAGDGDGIIIKPVVSDPLKHFIDQKYQDLEQKYLRYEQGFGVRFVNNDANKPEKILPFTYFVKFNKKGKIKNIHYYGKDVSQRPKIITPEDLEIAQNTEGTAPDKIRIIQYLQDYHAKKNKNKAHAQSIGEKAAV